MIISKTPYRISFFGGGSDFPEHFRQYGSSVLSCAINKYCFLNVRKLPPFFDHKYRAVYSKIENISEIDEFQHPSVKAVLKYFDLPEGISVIHDGDIPARSGIGSSSAFTVGLLNSMFALTGRHASKRLLAETAIHIEQDLIGETVGCQDQISCAYGGLNLIRFFQDGSFRVLPLDLEQQRLDEFKSSLLLVYTGISRISSIVASEQKSRIHDNASCLCELAEMAEQAERLLRSGGELAEFGIMLHEAWKIKRGLSSKISSDHLDSIYETARSAGAVGGKLLGAGAGGFMLFFVPPVRQDRVREALHGLLNVPFDFEMDGSGIIFNGGV